MSTARDLDADLALATDLAERAAAITSPAFDARRFTVDWKANRTEVTEIDRGVEAMVAEALTAARPHDGVFGEEHGLAGAAAAPWRWIVDPIDGTSNFVRGIPVWATLIALTHVELGPVVGVVSAPALGTRWSAVRGGGATANGRACRVSEVAHLEEAQVCVTFSKGWDDLGLTGQLVELQQAAYRARGFGDFWQHMLVAEGAVDLAIDAVGVAAYDLAAVQVVVEEAGGAFTDRNGRRGYTSDTAISSNGLLHDAAIARLAS